MLVVENWERGFVKGLAMLLHESPSRDFLPGGRVGEPWRAGGALAEAASSADEFGYAWLVIVFQNDNLRTWGEKKVKVVAGGRVFVRVEGVLRELLYETVVGGVFGTLGAAPTCAKSEYKVVTCAEIIRDPDEDDGLGDDVDPVLGCIERRLGGNSRGEVSKQKEVVDRGFGCKLTWEDCNQYVETWFLQDAQGFQQYRFGLTEYVSRPFVRVIMVRLGFVSSTTGAFVPTHSQGLGHLRNIESSLQALAALYDANCGIFAGLSGGATASRRALEVSPSTLGPEPSTAIELAGHTSRERVVSNVTAHVTENGVPPRDNKRRRF